MKAQATDGKDHDRIAAGVPFVEAMARRHGCFHAALD